MDRRYAERGAAALVHLACLTPERMRSALEDEVEQLRALMDARDAAAWCLGVDEARALDAGGTTIE